MQGASFSKCWLMAYYAGALFLVVGVLCGRRRTFEISEYGGLCTPMPKLAAFFSLIALSSMGLPMLNGFVGEFLILLGTYQARGAGRAGQQRASSFPRAIYSGPIKESVCGPVTHEKNKELPDTSPREISMLWVLSVVILWMGINSPFFTRRFAVSCKTVLQQMNRNVLEEAAVPPATLHSEGSTERLASR